MTGIGATPSLPRYPAKVHSPSHLRTLLIVYCQRVVFEFTTYALASRLRVSWMEARVTKAARVSARCAKPSSIARETAATLDRTAPAVRSLF